MGFGPTALTRRPQLHLPRRMDPDWPDWKKDQFLQKQKLLPALVYVGLTLNLQIKEFKRHFKGQSKSIANYKKGVWDQIRERSKVK